MAEPLSRYSSQGVQLRIPKVDFTASRVQAQNFASLSQSLDRMSAYYFNIAKQQAKIEGAEYGAENAPTMEQIQKSIDSGEPLNITGDKFSVFGQYARNASLTSVADKIEFAISNEIASTISLFNEKLLDTNLSSEERKNYEPQELRDKLNAIVEGYASSLDQISPGTGAKLRASGAITANSKYVTFNDKWIDNENKRNKALTLSNFALMDQELYDVIASNADNLELVNKLVSSQKTKRIQLLLPFNPSQTEIKNVIDNFDENLKKTANKIIDDYLLKVDNPGGVLEDLRDNLNNPNSKELPKEIRAGINLLENLGVSRNDIVKQLKTEYRANLNFEEEQKNIKIQSNTREIKSKISEAYFQWFKGNAEKADEIMNEYRNMNGKPLNPEYGETLEEWDKFKEQESKTDREDDEEVVIYLRAKTNNLTISEVVENWKLGKLSKQTAVSLIEEAESYRQDEYKSAIEDLKIALFPEGNSDVMLLDPDKDQKLAVQLYNSAFKELKTIYRTSLKDGNFDEINWDNEVKTILEDVDVKVGSQVIIAKKNSVITTIRRLTVSDLWTATDGPPDVFKNIERGKPETLTEDMVEDMLSILLSIQSNIDKETNPSKDYKALYNTYKREPNKLNRDITKLEEALEELFNE